MKRTIPFIDINLLGTFNVRVAGETVTFPYQKPQILLAYLITEARPVYRGHVSTLLWPGRSDHHARQNLRQAMASLKHLFGESFEKLFNSTRQTLEFIGYDCCNIDIEQLKAAEHYANHSTAHAPGTSLLLDIYRGPFCYGFRIPGSPAFAEWMETRQQEFRSLAVSLGLKLVERYRHTQQEQQAIQSYTRLLTIERHDESLLKEFMKYLVNQGRRLQAISLFHEHEARLKQEYGLQPDGHLRSLYESLTIADVAAS